MTLPTNSDNFPIQHSTIHPSKQSTVLCSIQTESESLYDHSYQKDKQAKPGELLSTAILDTVEHWAGNYVHIVFPGFRATSITENYTFISFNFH